MNVAKVLPGREVRSSSETAWEQVARIPKFDLRQPITYRDPSLLGDFKLDRPPCFPLYHGASVPHPAAGPYVIDLQADEIAASELAIDCKVEQGEISFPALQLKPKPNGPHIFRLERALLADQSVLIPGSPVGRYR